MNTTVDPSSDLILRCKDILHCELGGEIAILNPESGLYFGLDKVAAFLWERLDDPVTVGQLCEAVSSTFDVEETVCRAHIIEFVSQLKSAGLVVSA